MNESNEIVVPLALVSIETFGEGESRSPKPVLLIPDGEVVSANGTFYFDAASAERVIAHFRTQRVDLVVDFEHASCEGYETREGIAPAAGWVTDLWYEKNKGLFGKVEWNERGRSLVRAKEYKYLSPAVGLDRATRRVTRLDSIALTHKPAIVGGLPVAASRKKPTDMEINAMDPAEHEKLIGELRAILLDKGVELEDTSDSNAILAAAIAALKGTAKEKPAEGEDAEIAASVRKRFGLANTASKSEVLLRLSLVDVDGERRRDAETRLAAFTDADTDRQAKTLVDKHVQANRINPRDQEQYAAALVFAKEDPARFEQIMGATKPLVAAGRTTAPDQAVGQRGTIVAKASREFDDNPQIQKLTDKQSHVSLALRDAGLSKLSSQESERLIAG